MLEDEEQKAVGSAFGGTAAATKKRFSIPAIRDWVFAQYPFTGRDPALQSLHNLSNVCTKELLQTLLADLIRFKLPYRTYESQGRFDQDENSMAARKNPQVGSRIFWLPLPKLRPPKRGKAAPLAVSRKPPDAGSQPNDLKPTPSSRKSLRGPVMGVDR
jgi:hypothetical protein